MVQFWQPDFDRLPAGAKSRFEIRVAELPLDRVRTRIDVDAVLHNERRFFGEYNDRHGLDPDRAMTLLNWHLRAVRDHVSATHPDLVSPHTVGDPRPVGTLVTSMARPPRQPVRWYRACSKFLAGWGCWFRNRGVDLRAVSVRRRAAWFRRHGTSTNGGAACER